MHIKFSFELSIWLFSYRQKVLCGAFHQCINYNCLLRLYMFDLGCPRSMWNKIGFCIPLWPVREPLKPGWYCTWPQIFLCECLCIKGAYGDGKYVYFHYCWNIFYSVYECIYGSVQCTWNGFVLPFIISTIFSGFINNNIITELRLSVEYTGSEW